MSSDLRAAVSREYLEAGLVAKNAIRELLGKSISHGDNGPVIAPGSATVGDNNPRPTPASSALWARYEPARFITPCVRLRPGRPSPGLAIGVPQCARHS